MKQLLLAAAIVWFLWEQPMSLTCTKGQPTPPGSMNLGSCMSPLMFGDRWHFVDAYDAKEVCEAKQTHLEGVQRQYEDEVRQQNEGKDWYSMTSTTYTCLPMGLHPTQAGRN